MVASGRGPNDRDIAHLTEATRQIKAEFPGLEICVSLGLMSEPQARELKESGVAGSTTTSTPAKSFTRRFAHAHLWQTELLRSRM